MGAAVKAIQNHSGDPNSMSLFGNDDHDHIERQSLDLPNAEIYFYPSLFTKVEADRLFHLLLADIEWKHDKIRYYGRGSCEINVRK